MFNPSLESLHHNVLGGFGQFRHVLQRLPQRRCRQRERLIVFEFGAILAVTVLFVRRRRRGCILGLDMGGVLQLRPRRQAVDLDDAGIAHIGLHAEGVAHRAGDDLQLLLVLIGEGDQHDEEADQEPHEVGKGDEPAVAAAVGLLTARHRSGS